MPTTNPAFSSQAPKGRQLPRPSQLRGSRDLGAAAAFALWAAACMPSPPLQNTAADQATQTGVATSAIAPSVANPNQASNGNAAQGTFTAVGQGAQASMTLASHAANDFCLTSVAPTGAAGSANITTFGLRPCTGATEQRWVLVNGQLQNAGGLCLSLGSVDPSNGALQPTLATCAPADNNQQMLVVNGAIYVLGNPNVYALTTKSQPGSQAVVQFWPASLADANGLTWDFGQSSHSDAGVTQIGGTTLIALELAPNGCLTQNPNTLALTFGPCAAADPSMAWRLTGPTGTLSNLGRCLDANNNVASMVLCNGNSTQNWSFKGGLLVTNNGNCLLSTAQSGAAIGPCDFAQGPHMVLGLSL